MQTGADLVSAGYPTARAISSLLGGLSNVAQGNIPARTNLDYPIGSLVDGTSPAGGVCLSVPVPVVPGDVITKVTWLIGATSASVPGNSHSALYAGTGSAPVLLGQTADTGTVAIASGVLMTHTFASPVTISSTNAPVGFVYVSYQGSANTLPTLVSGTVASVPFIAITAGSLGSGAPRFIAATHDSATGSAAPATMGTQTAVAKAPVVFLT